VVEVRWYSRMVCFHQMHFVTGATELYNFWIISNWDYIFAAEHMIGQRAIWETRHILSTNVRQERKCTYTTTFRLLSVTVVAVEKQCVTYSECVPVACYPVRKAHASCYIKSVSCPAVPHRSTLSSKLYNFRKTVTKCKTRVLIFPTILLEKFLILTRFQWGSIYHKCP
jgi:hypothetical protein